MRILAGRYKGRKILTRSDTSYRPTQSRIRKSLFDILGPLDGTFLDLYAGSGIIGFEAASRGADHVTFVENDHLTIKLLKDNAAHFSDTEFLIINKDVLSFLKNCDDCETIFADPPYKYTQLDELVKLGCDKKTLNGTFVLESRTGAEVHGVDDVRTYGDTQLHFWKS